MNILAGNLRTTPGRAALAAALCLLAGGAAAGERTHVPTGGSVPASARLERAVLGAPLSGDWRNLSSFDSAAVLRSFGQDGGSGPGEFGAGGAAPRQEDGGGSDLGTKVKAGLLSAALPGAGQYYNGKKQKAYIMGGVEVAVWTAYFVFDRQGDNRQESAEEFASIYAGTGGEHDENYWQHVSRYMDSDAYNEERYREARALQEPVSGLIGPGDAWQWVNEDRMYGFRKLRVDAASAYDRRDFMILFAVVNRAVSVVDAVMGAGKDEPALKTAVLGMDLELDMLPSWRDPGARCTVSRKF
ncbi:MAG: hypothetical protein AB7V45_10930 [Candidatus Krumholzibacteriia bacterium]